MTFASAFLMQCLHCFLNPGTMPVLNCIKYSNLKREWIWCSDPTSETCTGIWSQVPVWYGQSNWFYPTLSWLAEIGWSLGTKVMFQAVLLRGSSLDLETQCVKCVTLHKDASCRTTTKASYWKTPLHWSSSAERKQADFLPIVSYFRGEN